MKCAHQKNSLIYNIHKYLSGPRCHGGAKGHFDLRMSSYLKNTILLRRSSAEMKLCGESRFVRRAVGSLLNEVFGGSGIFRVP